MFGSDVTMLKPVALFVRVCKNVFCFWRERQFNGGRDLFTEQCAAFDLLANRLDGNLSSREKASGQGLVFTHQTQQKVFRFDGRSTKLGRFIAREKDNSPRFFGVAFEHLGGIIT